MALTVGPYAWPVVLAVLAMVVVLIVGSGDADAGRLVGDDTSLYGVLQAAGLLFFAFAGYARIATLGEEVRDRHGPFRVPSPWRWPSRW
jgi:amino acid transporter